MLVLYVSVISAERRPNQVRWHWLLWSALVWRSLSNGADELNVAAEARKTPSLENNCSLRKLPINNGTEKLTLCSRLRPLPHWWLKEIWRETRAAWEQCVAKWINAQWRALGIKWEVIITASFNEQANFLLCFPVYQCRCSSEMLLIIINIQLFRSCKYQKVTNRLNVY